MLSSKQIEPADFREMKTEYSNKLEKLEAKLSTCNNDQVDIKDLLDKGINNLIKLEHIYETSDTEKKREIISSMYPEKMTFDGFSFRTNRIDEVARLIYSMDVGLSENKNRTSGSNSSLSCEVGMARFELATSWSQTRRDNRATLHPERKNSFLRANLLAERVGVEPTVQFNPYDDLANRSFRPLRHLSVLTCPFIRGSKNTIE